MNKNMRIDIRDKEIFQFFGDSTYRCVPPTFRSYKLYIISGFHLVMKITRILSYVLIPNEKEETYYVLFNTLKMDFQKSSAKEIKKAFPRIYLIKCFFHFIQCLYKYIIKLKLNKKEYKNEIFEILFNIKLLSFIKPENIPLINKKEI